MEYFYFDLDYRFENIQFIDFMMVSNKKINNFVDKEKFLNNFDILGKQVMEKIR